MKVAIITDWMVSPGGSDRMVKQLVDHFEEAEIFTSVFIPKNYLGHFTPATRIKTTFLQSLSLNGRFYRHLNILAPFAFENIDLRGFDLVISLSAGSAKGVITAPDQPHISIILTPPRSLWFESEKKMLHERGIIYKSFSPIISKYLQRWDKTAIHRADLHLSISKFIQERVKDVYGIQTEVLYPGISSFWFDNSNDDEILRESGVDKLVDNGQFYLIVSRLYKYKRIDRAIDAMYLLKDTGKKLLIVGTGPDEKYLQKNSPDNVFFLGYQEDELIRALYRNTTALIFCGTEDFGYVPVEAMASGSPVIAFDEGGVTETVESGVSGEFFQNNDQLIKHLRDFDPLKYDKVEIINRAEEFSMKRFFKQLDQFIATIE